MYLLPIWLMPTPHSMTVWPGGLRRWLKAPFRKGMGSNPKAVNAAVSEHTHNIMALVTRSRIGMHLRDFVSDVGLGPRQSRLWRQHACMRVGVGTLTLRQQLP